jgi:peptidoglycan L-alanyl-D-glutamate endopeptidase CwlK
MASRKIEDLVGPMQPQVRTLIANCLTRGVEIRPYQTLRDPFEQARLWRQSRAHEEIARKIAELTSAGALFLAHCLDSVGPQSGDPVTNAIPGCSWHQWGEALDCMWIVSGATEWSTTRKVGGVNGYRAYGDEAVRLGLTAGGFFTSLKDWPHVQLRTAGSPMGALTLREIDRTMNERFG